MDKEALLYEKLAGGRVKCTACARRCNMPEGKIGFCGIRRNIGGRLHLLVYGKITAANVDPIEKKPVVHFMPGSNVFSISTAGCSWICQYCQNYDISQRRRVEGSDVTSRELVDMAKRYECEGLAYTYNEPMIFMEFARDTGVLARREGLVNLFVSNGYGTPETVKMMNEFLDCITVDFKGNAETSFLRNYAGIPDAEPVFQSLLDMKRNTKIHIEITDLVVPEVGDKLDEARRLSRWIYDNLGPDTPLHFLRFHPDYKMLHLPWTPTKTLERHHQVAKEEGLNYVYLGNVPSHHLEHTYCPGCGGIAVKRAGFDILSWNLDDHNKCMRCGYQLPIVGKLNRAVLKRSRFLSIA